MKILAVQKKSIAKELKIKAGDEVTAFDGFPVTDILDYEYYNSLENFTLTVKRGEKIIDFEIEKYDDETLGLEFDGEIKVRSCRNNCIFCFVNQLPKIELRDTLRVYDDDYRHSFISGTFVTLTNVSQFDIERIIRLKLSPLYVSVHTTNDELRRKMLGIEESEPILQTLKNLQQNGIELHAQIVYCPGINDDIEKTITDLNGVVKTLAVIPVGLTKNGNPQLSPVTKENAMKVLQIIDRFKQFNFVFAADELYIKAGTEIPKFEHYGDFEQIENGVGLIAKFKNDFDYAFKNIEKGHIGNVSIATGESAHETIKYHSEILTKKFGGTITVYKITNDFFGSSVSVAGLITGVDIFNQLKDKNLQDRLIIPSVMLKEFSDVFLDNMSLSELSQKLNIKIETADSSGGGFVNAIVRTKN